MRSILSIVALFSFIHVVHAQEADTVKKQLDEVTITGYLSRQPIVTVPASVAVLDSRSLSNGSQQSLLPVMNTIPGVRMEERSPGSYRLSIRGSLLRSPFGVRNVKVYFNDLPLTDASGNTYLNLVDPAMLQRVEILKGPDGSLFGANSGGVVLLESHLQDSAALSGSVSGGSYGLFRQHLMINQAFRKTQWNFSGAWQQSDGYREQSFMKRMSMLGSGKVAYGSSNSVKATVLLSNIHYETPGGLTKEQFTANPRSARLPSQTPGAVQQQAGIYNTTLFGGITNEFQVSPAVKHVISVFGTLSDYENPAIGGYELRKERNGGLRTYVSFTNKNNLVKINLTGGVEGQAGSQRFSGYDNNGGVRGTLDSVDRATVRQMIYFSRFTVDVSEKVTAEVAVSLNQYAYAFRDLITRDLSHEWMPRFAVSYRLLPEFALRASVSKGYSPPTLAEIRPSEGVINETLRAESGWNKEAGVRFSAFNGRIQADASVFRYDLRHAIVRRTNDQAEFFLNSGGTKQTGLELLLSTTLVPGRNTGLVRRIMADISYAHNRFEFEDYHTGTEDYSGNRVTGVPRTSWVTGITVDLPERVNVFVQAMFVARLPLNDANDEYADKYELLQARISWTVFKHNARWLEMFAGSDNLLDQTYSLGNDLNAAGRRYYNAAPLRNFYGGIKAVLP